MKSKQEGPIIKANLGWMDFHTESSAVSRQVEEIWALKSTRMEEAF